jgi:hypothetical protein
MYRTLSLLLITALSMPIAARPTLATARTDRAADKQAEHTAKVRDNLLRLGTGPHTRIELTRRDGTRLKGSVTAADETSFTVADAEGRTTQVPYDDVRKVKGQNLATGWKIAIGVGIGIGVVLLVVGVLLTKNSR